MTNKEKIKQMTFSEKAMLLTGKNMLTTAELDRLGVPSIEMSDGPHGVRTASGKPCSVEGGCICFPTASAASATWNRELLFKMGVGLARDCIKEEVDVLLGPGINIKRHPLCGRNFEYFSEDPMVAGELGAAYINGVQSCGIGTSLKHFAANNQEIDRGTGSSEIDERTLREIYLRGFEIAVKKAKPTSVMNAYNKLNAIYCSENKWLLKDILRDEWGFDGVVISDWGSVHNISKALKNGMNLQMPTNTKIEEQLKDGVEKGIITEEEIDEVLEALLNFLDATKAAVRDNTPYDRDAQHAIAKEIADEAMTLLKNEDNILPIDVTKYPKIVVLGGLAEMPTYMGGGSSTVHTAEEKIEKPLDFIREYIGDKAELTYVPLYTRDTMPNRDGIRGDGAVAASKADLAIVFAGSLIHFETEGLDKPHNELENYMNTCIEWINKACKNVIVVLQNGSAIVPGRWKDDVKGIVEMWISGEAGGSAIADVLFGKVNPSGKLAETFSYTMNPLLDYPGDGFKVTYPEQWKVGYRYFDLHPEQIWYPFGHGLSYTTFEYSDISVSPDGVNGPDADVTVKCKITNTGKLAGKETVQLYVNDVKSIISKPVKELKGFEKIHLEPGETKEVEFKLGFRDFAYYNVGLKDWHVESGAYKILIGASSRDIRLEADYLIKYDKDYTVYAKDKTTVADM
ncbi:MAG: glycosyl hydrolase [Ruminococcaceae bacterium]|nr:glycosyl hydrolase [Oscillospiraceae bacterium]